MLNRNRDCKHPTQLKFHCALFMSSEPRQYSLWHGRCPFLGGKLVALAGLDGSGKSTLAQALAQWMEEEFQTPCLYVHGMKPSYYTAELEAVAAQLGTDRRSLFSPTLRGLAWCLDLLKRWQELMEPALAAGHSVICDRYTLCNLVFTSSNQGDIRLLRRLHTLLPRPDLYLFLNIDLEQALERIRRRGRAATQKESPEQLARSSSLYAELGSEWSLVRLDAGQNLEQVLGQAIALLKDHFAHKATG